MEHKGDREEDTCQRNRWDNEVVMRWDVTDREIPGDPPDLGSSYSCGGICGPEQEKSSESADAAYIFTHSLGFDLNQDSPRTKQYATCKRDGC